MPRVARNKPAAETPAPAPAQPTPTPAPDETPEQTEGQGGQTTAVAVAAGRRSLSIPGVKAQFTPTALILPEKLTLKDWIGVVDAIDGVREGSRWWFGDAINAGEARFGEKYSQALDAFRYDYASLRNLAMVARRFAPDTIVDGEIVPGRRHQALSWSHHHAVIGVPNEVADEILTRAEAEGWAVAAVRAHVKEIKAGATPDLTPRNNGNGTGGILPGMAPRTTSPQDLPGIKPLTDAQIAEYAAAGTTVYDCEGCALAFDVQVWHCLGCSGHYALDVDECPNPHCGEDGAEDGQTDPAPAVTAGNGTAPRVVTGEVVPADTGVDQALTVLVSFPFSDLDPSDIAAALSVMDGVDAMSSLMAVHHWIGQVIEALPSDDGRDGPVAPDDAETASDNLGDLDFEAEDATETPPAPAAGAWSTAGANVTPGAAATVAPRATATATATKPLTPAPKPGTAGKPVRRRAAKAE